MTLLEQIQALPPEILSTQDTAVIAGSLPASVSIAATPIGIGTILAVMAPSGGDFLNALEALGVVDANVKWSLRLIEKADFDVGHPVTRAQLQAFAIAQPTMATAIEALLAVAETSVPVNEMDVRKLCWSDNGDWQV